MIHTVNASWNVTMPGKNNSFFMIGSLIKSLESVTWVMTLFIILFLSCPGIKGNVLAASGCTTPECNYYKAEKAYNTLLKSPKLKSRRDKWVSCINGFKKVYDQEPDGPWAPAGLYMAGLLSKNLYNYSSRSEDLSQAIELLEKTTDFRKSKYSLEAVKLLRALPQVKKEKEPETRNPVQETIKNTTQSKTDTRSSQTTVKDLRFGTLPTRTRIVIDTDNAVSYKHGLLRKDPENNKLQRLYIDIRNSQLSPKAKTDITIDDERVMGIRTAAQSNNVVRVAIDIKTFKDYKIFSLRSPSRVVIDVWGKSSSPELEDEQEQDDTDTTVASTTINSIINTKDLAKQLQLGVKRVVIDPGHGGQDRGAPGYFKGVYEKDIVLSLAKKLAAKLTKELDLEVIMTRSDDTFITLEERTQMANRKKADLFISIHTNASRDKRAYGIETYFLNLAKDKHSVSVAARENATSEKNISDLQTILDSLMRNTKIIESSKLATYVQDDLYAGMRKKYSSVKNKGVKQAPFYVLLGARMPAILVETSFISNKRECTRLRSNAYQDRICDSIVEGVRTYIKKTSPH